MTQVWISWFLQSGCPPELDFHLILNLGRIHFQAHVAVDTIQFLIRVRILVGTWWEVTFNYLPANPCHMAAYNNLICLIHVQQGRES